MLTFYLLGILYFTVIPKYLRLRSKIGGKPILPPSYSIIKIFKTLAFENYLKDIAVINNTFFQM